AAPIVLDKIPPARKFQDGVITTDARIVVKEVGDIAVRVTAKYAASAQMIDPLALVRTMRSCQYRHCFERPHAQIDRRGTSAQLPGGYRWSQPFNRNTQTEFHTMLMTLLFVIRHPGKTSLDHFHEKRSCQ